MERAEVRGLGLAVFIGLTAIVAAFFLLVGGEKAGVPAPVELVPVTDSESATDEPALTPATEPIPAPVEVSAPETVVESTSDPVQVVRPIVDLQSTGHDPELEADNKAFLTVTVFEGNASNPLVNHPVRVEPTVFRPGRPVPPVTRTDSDGRVRMQVPAGESMRVLVLEEFRNVTKLEERMRPIEAGLVGTLDVVLPLPPLVSMWLQVVSEETGEPVAGARVWIERLLRIDDEPVLETFVEIQTDRNGRGLLTWPFSAALGGRAEKAGVGVARFVPVDQRGTEAEPFEIRLGAPVDRGARNR